MTGLELVRLASGYWASSALHAAVGLELFAELRGGGTTAQALAEQKKLCLSHLEALLNALVGVGVLEKREGVYRIEPGLARFLDPDSPDSLLGALHFNAELSALWQELPRCITEGEPVVAGNPHLGEDPERLRHFVRGMHSRASVMAGQVLDAIAIPKHARILDVGGGPGTLSVKLLERHPSAYSVVLDLPPVVSVGRDLHQGREELGRVEYLPGDYHHTPFPGEMDVVLYCGALHQEPAEGVGDLFRKLVGALRPGGRLVVVDLFVDDTRTVPAYSALFELNMMLMRPESHVYSLPQVEGLLQACGMTDVVSRQLPESLYGIVEGVCS